MHKNIEFLGDMILVSIIDDQRNVLTSESYHKLQLRHRIYYQNPNSSITAFRNYKQMELMWAGGYTLATITDNPEQISDTINGYSDVNTSAYILNTWIAESIVPSINNYYLELTCGDSDLLALEVLKSVIIDSNEYGLEINLESNESIAKELERIFLGLPNPNYDSVQVSYSRASSEEEPARFRIEVKNIDAKMRSAVITIDGEDKLIEFINKI